MVGGYERAFFGDQLIELLPVFARYGVQLWLPEAIGPGWSTGSESLMRRASNRMEEPP